MSCTTTCVAPTPAQAHCGKCHRTFSGITLFDDHLVGPVDALRCLEPYELLAKHPLKFIRGVWRYDVPRTNIPGPTPERGGITEAGHPDTPGTPHIGP